MIFQDEPPAFSPRFDVVSCFLEHEGEILLLHRQDHKPEGNTWGVPAGKVDAGEEPEAAMIRELEQETGYKAQQSELEHFTKVYVRYPEYDFGYHIYRIAPKERPYVTLNPGEHKSSRWISPAAALQENLIRDLDACIKLFYRL